MQQEDHLDKKPEETAKIPLKYFAMVLDQLNLWFFLINQNF